MHKYFITTPWLVKKIFSSYVWSVPTKERVVYLTFDDGPHPEATPFVLDELKKYEAKATFFCIGKNVLLYPEIYQRILQEGHAAGNHTQNHLNGWKVPAEEYLEDVTIAATHITSNLFRPPYGKISTKQAKGISKALNQTKAMIIMWDVLSADFDVSISKEECLGNVLNNYSNGSIIVFHDSFKAYSNLKYVLPLVLKALSEEGYRFEHLDGCK